MCKGPQCFAAFTMSVLTSSTFESCDGVLSVPEKYRDIAFWMLNLAVVPANMTKESDPSTWTQAPRNWQWIQAESEFQVQERPIDANIGTGDALVLEAEPHEQSLQVQVPQHHPRVSPKTTTAQGCAHRLP